MMGERQELQLSPEEILEECEAVDAQHCANMKRLFPNMDLSKVRELRLSQATHKLHWFLAWCRKNNS